ncbi:MAG: hypothetical protein E3J83_01790 [Candidatus Atribacteria bacterium]|nr:MAG: hypothetical protein E3J83_01790 [Candidatus Atribacteria bacterium]
MIKLHDEIMNNLIEAVKQERQRIEKPKNRSRYFIYGKIRDWHNTKGYYVTFENIPDRALKDAKWSDIQDKSLLFRIGDIFIPGNVKIESRGLSIFFSINDINKLNIDITSLKRMTDIGIDYIMDNRELTEHLLIFLKSKAHIKNEFLEHLTSKTSIISVKNMRNSISNLDLNLSQKNTIEKALSQKITFIWGPPGTGKTKTMGALAASLIKNKKRVLLTGISNMALDQLLLMTLDQLRNDTSKISIARLGSTMDDKCQGFSRNSFKDFFNVKREGASWSEHIKYASLVAGNFTMLTFPYAPDPGLFDYVIVDEVSMANIPSLISTSFFAKIGIVLGGDPFQLPPIYPEDAEEPNEWLRANIFEKAGITQSDDPRSSFLDIQYRMQYEIGNLVSEMFYKDVGGLKTRVDFLEPIRGFGGRVVFIHSPGIVKKVGAGYLNDEEHRRFNEVHAEVAIKATLVGLKNGVKPSEIGIIVPYNAQVVQISQKLQQFNIDSNEIKVSTIHSFQGQERRMIIVDFTDDNIKPTHLTANWKLINVALSRAKEQLIMIGNQDYLMSTEYFNENEISIFKRLLKHTRILYLQN